MEMKSVAVALEHWAEHRPDRVFVRNGDVAITYRDAIHRARSVAGGLTALGMRKGDRLAIIATTRPEHLELVMACGLIGVVQVPLNIYLKGAFLRHQLIDSAAETIVVDSSGLQAVTAVLGELPPIKNLILLDHDAEEHIGVNTVSYLSLHDSVGHVPAVNITGDDTMSIIYTSGTTGLPKGCVLTQGYYMRVGAALEDLVGLNDDDIIISALPLFHGAARMMVMAACLRKGLTAVLEPVFHTSFLQRVIETRATVMVGVAAMGRILMAQPASEADRSHNLRIATWGPSDPALEAAVRDRFAFEVISQIYGQTECAMSTYAPFNHPATSGSAGHCDPDLELKLVDEDDEEVPIGQVGEIVFRPRHRHRMFRGYWGRPEETLHTFRGLWYHTGDFGRLDQTGALFFVDRKKDYLRRRGENVSSMEVEAAIIGHPKVAEVAVHAVPSELTEDDIKACIVAVEGERLEPEELYTYFAENLPYYTMPRYVEIMPELPKNALSRVMKHVLRDRGITTDTWDFERLGFSLPRSARR
jgi:crotonobetaine/carnitine-CoA ligase